MHMIIVTWIETRAWLREYGKPIAALWRAEADQEQYEYACEYVSRSGYYPQGDAFPPAGHYAMWLAPLWDLLDRNGDLFFCPFRPDGYRPGDREWSTPPDGEPRSPVRESV